MRWNDIQIVMPSIPCPKLFLNARRSVWVSMLRSRAESIKNLPHVQAAASFIYDRHCTGPYVRSMIMIHEPAMRTRGHIHLRYEYSLLLPRSVFDRIFLHPKKEKKSRSYALYDTTCLCTSQVAIGPTSGHKNCMRIHWPT
jgi:hypothetical protein